MGGNSVYVDPDTVSRISSQIARCADEIESVRSSIVPQVYEVIDRGLGVNLLLDASVSLGATHDSIVYFNHEALVVVQDLRISAKTLQQIAAEAWRMEQELLQQATVFSRAGQAGSSSANGSSDLPQWLQDINTLNKILGTTLFTIGLKPINDFLKDKPFFRDLFPLMGTAEWQIGFNAFQVLLDFANGKDHSPRAFLSDSLGAGIGFLIGSTPPGRIAGAASFIIGMGGSLMASEQTWLGNIYGGAIGNQLKQPSQGLLEAAGDGRLGSLYDHIGRLLIDEAGKPDTVMMNPALAPIAVLNGVAGAFGMPISRPEDVPADTGLIANDTWHVVRSVPEFAVNVGAATWDDGIALDNKFIHILPLPDSIKGFSETATENATGKINDAASFITHLLRLGS